MKSLVTLLTSITFLFAQNILNPHDYQLDDSDKDKNCIECHFSNVEETGIETVRALSPMACFDCHDGVSALDRSINIPGSGAFFPTSHYRLNLSDDLEAMSVSDISTAGSNLDLSHGHPISILYIEGLSDLRSKHTPLFNWDNASSINDILIDGKIECASCHNPHDKEKELYLRYDNSSSVLCAACHDK